MKSIRFIIGRLILLLDFLTRPSPVSRSHEDQDRVDAATSHFSLYQFNACPFCVKVRRHMRRRSLKIKLRDAKSNIEIKNELIKEGGRHKVPCLRIEIGDEEIKWLYSSDKICAFLDDQLNKLKVV
ncbi:glutaredoxin [Candidatus Puniceispirillum sp.]|nr:glutaredoxin [Candidatus Puniceispirillum sp.]